MTFGWFLVALALLALNGYVAFCLVRMPFQRRRRLKTRLALGAHALLTLPCIVYFPCFFTGRTGSPLVHALSYAAGFYLVILLYAALLFALADLARCTGRLFAYPLPLRRWSARLYYRGLPLLLIAAILAAFGLSNGRALDVVSYDISLPRGASSLSSLHAVLLADAHIGTSVREEELRQIVEQVNALQPDVVFLCGDLYDEGTTAAQKQAAGALLGRIRSRYGTYAVTGNHEYASPHLSDELAQLQAAGIHLLLDGTQVVPGRFCVAGRLDAKSSRRAPLAEVLQGADGTLPLILLDHRPQYKESRDSGRVDLLLSGHTHNGQIFPLDLFDPLVPALFYGAYTNGAMQTVVTSGAGSWAIPLRLGSTREIVDLHIRFDP